MNHVVETQTTDERTAFDGTATSRRERFRQVWRNDRRQVVGLGGVILIAGIVIGLWVVPLFYRHDTVVVKEVLPSKSISSTPATNLQAPSPAPATQQTKATEYRCDASGNCGPVDVPQLPHGSEYNLSQFAKDVYKDGRASVYEPLWDQMQLYGPNLHPTGTKDHWLYAGERLIVPLQLKTKDGRVLKADMRRYEKEVAAEINRSKSSSSAKALPVAVPDRVEKDKDHLGLLYQKAYFTVGRHSTKAVRSSAVPKTAILRDEPIDAPLARQIADHAKLFGYDGAGDPTLWANDYANDLAIDSGLKGWTQADAGKVVPFAPNITALVPIPGDVDTKPHIAVYDLRTPTKPVLLPTDIPGHPFLGNSKEAMAKFTSLKTTASAEPMVRAQK